jgi:signal transduction histidine kinase
MPWGTFKNVINNFVNTGLNVNLSSYEAKRALVFNYCNLMGLLASVSRLFYILFFSPDKYTFITIVANMLPLLACIIMHLCMVKFKYKAATYISFLTIPIILLIIYCTTLDYCIIFFQILYFIFPFFFLYRPRNIIPAFFLAASCFLLSVNAEKLNMLYYDSKFYPFDTGLAIMDSFFSMSFIFAALYHIKFQIWSYEKSIKRKSQELKELNIFKVKIFSLISHDLRSPFAAVSQVISLLKTTSVDQATYSEYMGDLEEQVQTASEMMDNILVWSKKQMNGQVVNISKVNLYQVISETCQLLNKQSSIKKVQLINDLIAPCDVLVDKEMATAIFRNLLSNAIKFSNPGGYVKIKQKQTTSNSLIIELEDNGIGIPTDKQELILKRQFYSTVGTSKESGSGLGLQICQDFVEKNNGHISFVSKPGIGTSFFVTLPAPLP